MTSTATTPCQDWVQEAWEQLKWRKYVPLWLRRALSWWFCCYCGRRTCPCQYDVDYPAVYVVKECSNLKGGVGVCCDCEITFWK